MALPLPYWTFFSRRFKVRVDGAGCIVVLTLGGRMKTRRLFTAAVLSLFIAWVAAGAAEAQPRSIKGEVTDVATGDPLPGVTVTIEGTTLSATTASDGTFTVPDAPSGALTVQLRAPGYRGATVSVPENQSDVRVGLTRELAEEIVVTGRASRTERRNLGVSIATVKSEDLTETPAQTVDTALQGKVTGANIQRNDGAPGGGVQVRLRGVSSIQRQRGAALRGGRDDRQQRLGALRNLQRDQVQSGRKPLGHAGLGGQPPGRLQRRGYREHRGPQGRRRSGHLRRQGQQRRHHHQHQARTGGAAPRGRDAAVRGLHAREQDRRPQLRLADRGAR